MRIGTASAISVVLMAIMSVQAVEPITIEVNAEAGSKGFIANGTMPIAVSIINASKADLELPGQFPRLNGLELSVSGIAAKPENFRAKYRQSLRGLLTVPAGSTYQTVFYLTDYYSFSEPGTARVVWTLSLPASQNAPPSSAMSASGSFEVNIRSASIPEARAELDHLASLYANASSDELRRPYIVGICSVHDPLVIPYLGRLVMGPAEGMREAMARLCLEWIDREDARAIVDQYIMTGTDGGILNFTIQAYVAHRRTLTQPQVARLLGSVDVETCYAGLWYSRHVLSDLDIKAISGIAIGQNPQLANEAQAIIDAFAQRENVDPDAHPSKDHSPKTPKPGF